MYLNEYGTYFYSATGLFVTVGVHPSFHANRYRARQISKTDDEAGCKITVPADQEESLHIREAAGNDLNDVLYVERLAFGHDKEAELVRELLNDASAEPLLSLLAFEDGQAVGHILFTSAMLTNTQDAVTIALLAPLAIVPEMQKQGIGGKLIREGLRRLTKSGVDLVFVLGHPEYYPRFGFNPAGDLGLEAPYPIPYEYADAWMVQALRPDIIGSVRGKVVCADALQKPEHWRE